MDPNFFVTNALIPFSTALAGNAGGEFLKPILKVFDNWFYKTFGSKSELDRKKVELRNAQELDLYKTQLEEEKNIGQFKSDLASKILNIPKENLTIPDKQIISKVMRNADYFIDIEELREYFSRILALSADKKMNASLHPTIIDTVNNLTKKEFSFIKKMNQSLGFVVSIKPSFLAGKFGQKGRYSYVSLETKFPDMLLITQSGYKDTLELDFEDKGKNFFIEKNSFASSISILKRLNIVREFPINECRTVGYFPVDSLKKIYDERLSELKVLNNYINQLKDTFDEDIKLSCGISVIQYTQFGANLGLILDEQAKFVTSDEINGARATIEPVGIPYSKDIISDEFDL